jgi:NADH-quinone oxidoreductase subunit M
MTALSTWLPAVLPFLGAVLAAAIGRSNPAARRWVGIAAAAAALVMAASALLSLMALPAGSRLESAWEWLPQYGLRLRVGVDALSAPLLLVSTVVGLCAVLALPRDSDRSPEHDVLILLTMGACNAAFSSRDLFFFYLFAEITTLPKYLLISRWARENPDPSKSPSRVALEATLYVLVGALFLLAVIALLMVSGSGDALSFDGGASALRNLAPSSAVLLFAVAAASFALWSGLWPFHAWAPPVYTAGRAQTNMLFGGVAKMFGLYGLLRLSRDLLPQAAEECTVVLLVIGSINILYGAWAAMRQRDWNRILAFASISHAGYTLVAIAVGSASTDNAAVALMLAHGLASALGFLLIDELEYSAGTRDPRGVSGLAKLLPALGAAFVAMAIVSTGIPGTFTFAAELSLFFAAWGDGPIAAQPAVVIAVLGVVLGTTYIFTPLHATFFGEASQVGVAEVRRARPRALFAAALLVLAQVGLGVFPQVVLDDRTEVTQ